jgi:hypothetical protein
MTTFTSVDEARLCTTMAACNSRLVYIAPGATAAVATAIGNLLDRRQPPAVTLIIDTDPEVYRLGYGTEEGLRALQSLVITHHIAIRYQPGLRVGVLIADETMLVYSPTPLLIEADSDRSDQPNAILVGADPLPAVLAACAAEGEVNAPLPSTAEIGCLPVTPDSLKETLGELARVPPKAFNVARIERVFSSKLQYVELEVTGYRLSSHKVSIPNDLLIGEAAALDQRLRNAFTLLADNRSLEVEIPVQDFQTLSFTLGIDDKPVMRRYSERQLEADRKKIEEDFLTNVPGFGWLIRRWDRRAFDARLKWFDAQLHHFEKGVQGELEKAIEKSVDELVAVLHPKLRENFPPRLLKSVMTAVPDDSLLRTLLRDELLFVFEEAKGRFEPAVSVQFKDLTYETIKDPRFRSAIERAFGKRGGVSPVAQMFQEYDAARESNSLSGEGKPT